MTRKHMKADRGYFITFEGGDGSGKSTQIDILRDRLEKRGYDVILTREPGGTRISEMIRDIILDKNNDEMDYMTEAMLYAAARAQLVKQVIEPALKDKKIVICDRFVDSSIAYQAYGRGLGDSVGIINSFAVGGCLPDVTFFLRVDPSIGSSRISSRERDRIEQEPDEFHKKVYNGYMELEEKFPDRIVGINASRSIEEIAAEIAYRVDNMIEG